MTNEQLTPPAEHLAGDDEGGEEAVTDMHARAPYFAYAAALSAMGQPDLEEDRHGD
jgi:hypothetical protein